jgi:hypothetical protein
MLNLEKFCVKDKKILTKFFPNESLKFFMEENGYKQKDLVHSFVSGGIASEVINGKRSISKTQAKKLAEFFKVSVKFLFIEQWEQEEIGLIENINYPYFYCFSFDSFFTGFISSFIEHLKETNKKTL